MRTQPTVVHGTIKLANYDAGFVGKLDKDKTKELNRTLAERIGELQDLLYANSTHAILLVFQGLDASGKDGAIKKVLRDVDPAGVQTANFKVPSAEEQAHDYLWRIHHALPRYGNIGVFNRSHYESVLAERVVGGLPAPVYRRRYREIVEFEQMLTANRVVLVKFFLHLSRAEQAERFRARLEKPEKKWKFSTGDLVTRRRWKEYQAAYEEMLNATSHGDARWHLVPADHKWYRDQVIARAVVDAMEALDMKWPRPKEDLSKIRIR